MTTEDMARWFRDVHEPRMLAAELAAKSELAYDSDEMALEHGGIQSLQTTDEKSRHRRRPITSQPVVTVTEAKKPKFNTDISEAYIQKMIDDFMTPESYRKLYNTSFLNTESELLWQYQHHPSRLLRQRLNKVIDESSRIHKDLAKEIEKEKKQKSIELEEWRKTMEEFELLEVSKKNTGNEEDWELVDREDDLNLDDFSM